MIIFWNLIEFQSTLQSLKGSILEESKALNHMITMFEKNFYNYLYLSVSNPGMLYGLRKIYKAVAGGITTWHIILSTIGTITYKLVKFFEKLLKPITFNEYTIKNYFSFVKEVEEFDPNLIWLVLM